MHAGCEALPLPAVWERPVNVSLGQGYVQAFKGYDGGLAYLTPHALSRSLTIPSHSEPSRRLLSFMRRLLDKRRAARAPLTVTVIGGSMTAGSACGHYKKVRSWRSMCSWPAYLHLWLEESFPGQGLRLFNIATGGTDTTVWASMGLADMPELQQADLVLAELSVNAAQI